MGYGGMGGGGGAGMTSGFAMGGYGGGFGMGNMGGGFMPAYGGPMTGMPGYVPQGTPPPAGQAGAAGAAGDQTGSYLGNGTSGHIPRVIPNPMDNTLLIQATPQEYQQIVKLLRQLDIPPRQVLIDAKIYEVSLSGAFASGVSVFLQQRSKADKSFLASLNDGLTAMSLGALVGQSRELLAFLQLAENATRSKVISSPSIIATDSIAASITVGSDVPVLNSSSVTPIQSGGNSLFANTVGSRSTGVNLNVLARVNPSGVVTLFINQDVSAPAGQHHQLDRFPLVFAPLGEYAGNPAGWRHHRHRRHHQ